MDAMWCPGPLSLYTKNSQALPAALPAGSVCSALGIFLVVRHAFMCQMTTLEELSLTPPCRFWEWTQLVRPGGRHLYMLKHLTSPPCLFYYSQGALSVFTLGPINQITLSINWTRAFPSLLADHTGLTLNGHVSRQENRL